MTPKLLWRVVGDRIEVYNPQTSLALTGGHPDNSAVVTALFHVYSFTLNRFLTVAESGWDETTRSFA